MAEKRSLKWLLTAAESLSLLGQSAWHAFACLWGQTSSLSISPQTKQQLFRELSLILLQPPIRQFAADRNETRIIERIRSETSEANRNNLTRTEAYRAIYFAHPELHWAFLAHMVSRNAGWNMTDLRGDFIPRLVSEDQAEHLFMFLERSNSLIFQDAYPQLLLYKQSREIGRSLFHLLPAFHVSRFMEPIWRHFWQHRDSVPLTVAMIINEQHYIEGRVARNAWYKATATDSIAFRLQSLMQLNHVLIPYAAAPDGSIGLAGLILEQFTDLHERIEFGKSLYHILFNPPVWEGAERFARACPHSGSRGDYLPELFTNHKPAGNDAGRQRLTGLRIKPGENKLYSPRLEDVWKDRPVNPPDRYDWFCSRSVFKYFHAIRAPKHYHMSGPYGHALKKLELAAIAAQKIQS